MKVVKVFQTKKEAAAHFQKSVDKLGYACKVNYNELFIYTAGVEYYHISALETGRLRGVQLDRAYIDKGVPDYLAQRLKAQVRRAPKLTSFKR